MSGAIGSLTWLLTNTDEGRCVLKPLKFKPYNIVGTEMAAPPITKNYTSVGTAFDYLTRWYMERCMRARGKTTHAREWIASRGAKYARGMRPDYIPVDKQEEVRYMADRLLEAGVQAYQKYMDTGVADRDTAAAVLGLAELDVVVRTGSIKYVWRLLQQQQAGAEWPARGDITDILALHATLSNSKTLNKLLDASDTIILNPVLGTDGIGADADIIINNTLIDIKTTKKPRFERAHWEQLCGYCSLARHRRIRIRRIGIYFSRHGVLETVGIPRGVDWRSILVQLKEAHGSAMRKLHERRA